MKTLLPPLAVLGSIISLCVGSSFAKLVFPRLGAEGMTACRVGFAALILLCLWRPWRMPLSKADAKAIVLYGLTLGVMNLMFYKAISTIPIGIAIAIEFTGPLGLALASSRRPLDFVWIGFALIGLVLLLPIHSGAKPLDPVGLGYILVAALCWALYIVLGKRAGTAHAGQVTSFGMMTAAGVVLPFGIARAGSALLNPALLMSGLAVAVLSSAIPYSLEMYALKRLPKQTFGILLSLEPAVGAIAGWIIIGEQLTVVQWLAILSVIVASVGSTASITHEKTPLAEVEPIAPD